MMLRPFFLSLSFFLSLTHKHSLSFSLSLSLSLSLFLSLSISLLHTMSFRAIGRYEDGTSEDRDESARTLFGERHAWARDLLNGLVTC